MVEKFSYRFERARLDPITGELKRYHQCEENAVADGYCIFHHPNYWRPHSDEVQNLFIEKLEDAIKNNRPFFCVGYNLPDVGLSRREFNTPLYFVNAVFHGEASFIGTKFDREVGFEDTHFYNGAYFNDAVFLLTSSFASRASVA